jgi:hypothetical protein
MKKDKWHWLRHTWSDWKMILVTTSSSLQTWQIKCCKQCGKVKTNYLFIGTADIEVGK